MDRLSRLDSIRQKQGDSLTYSLLLTHSLTHLLRLQFVALPVEASETSNNREITQYFPGFGSAADGVGVPVHLPEVFP